MEDFLFELLGLILEPIVEAIVGYVFGGLLDLLLRALGEVFKTEIKSPGLAACGYVLFGILTGYISLIFSPTALCIAQKFQVSAWLLVRSLSDS